MHFSEKKNRGPKKISSLLKITLFWSKNMVIFYLKFHELKTLQEITKNIQKQ